MDLKTFRIERAEEIARTASEIRWRQALLSQHLKNLRRCIHPRQSGHFYGLSMGKRAEVTEALLGEIALQLSGLLRGVNEARQSAQEFISRAMAEEAAQKVQGD